jgi:cobalt-zinc-cadmium efflux system membrane fusion protein
MRTETAMSDRNNAAAAARAGLAGLVRALPTALVLVALAGLGWWGHHTGWTLPSLASLSGGDVKEKEDWCDEHGVPESQCVECNPALMPRGPDYGWCVAHGIHNCPLEHPEVAQVGNPRPVAATDVARARRALDLLPRPENGSRCELYKRRIQFASEEAVEKAGIDVRAVGRAPLVESVSANGEVTYDQARVARLSARVPGSIWWAEKRVGEAVKRGEVLALVDAAEVGKAKADLVQAAIQHDLKRDFAGHARRAAERGAYPETELRAAESALREAEARLRAAEQALVNLGLPAGADDFKGLAADDLRRRVQFLGLPESIIRGRDPQTTTANLLPVVAPLDGVVVAREGVVGEVVDTARVLFVVADVRRMWVTLSLREEDAWRVRLGQPVRFRPVGADEEESGTVEWISTAADEKTRTVKARAVLPNDAGRLRANTFGRGRVILRDEPEAVVVPSEAVHWEGDCFVVFVRDRNYLAEGAPKVFHVRTVRVGVKGADSTEIIAGVLPGELVATRGSGALQAELLKDNTGEG